MKSASLFLLATLFYLALSLPTSYDIRFQPSAIFADYNARTSTVCDAYDWASEMAKIVGNDASMKLEEKIQLSAQNIVECITYMNDICLDSSLDNIHQALNLIQSTGIFEQSCYPNKFFEIPSEFCKRKCANGQEPIRTFRAKNKKVDDMESFLLRIGNGETSGLVVVKFYQFMNYYSANYPILRAEGDYFGLAVGQVVGWKQKGQVVTVRMGASGWGFKGYADINLNSGIIVESYQINLIEFADKKTNMTYE